MKKTLLTLAIALSASFTFAQRNIDWSVEEILQPTNLNSSSSTGTQIAFEVVLKNNGTDSVVAGDTITYQVVGIIGSNVVFAIPNGSLFFKVNNRTINSGDTIHFVGTVASNLYPNYSQNITLRFSSFMFNRAAGGITPEGTGTAANNRKDKNMIWYNPQGWGVSVNSIEAMTLSVSPNPASDEIVVTPSVMNAHGKQDISISDINGKVVFSGSYDNASEIRINTAAFDKGLYIISLNNGEMISTSKISVQ